jgi:futalosine hydrolase
MLKRVLIVVATEEEADAMRRIHGVENSIDGYYSGNVSISLLVTGMGTEATSWALKKWLSSNIKPDLAINIGIAGSFREEIKIGDVVVPVSDTFADEDFENGLCEIEADRNLAGRLAGKLKKACAITVALATGTEPEIARLLKKYNPDIETMEGAAFFYICSREQIPFLALRSISNRVEPRNKKNWDIPLALDNLSERLKEIMLLLTD